MSSPFDAEPLLLLAILMAVIGASIILVMLRRGDLLRGETVSIDTMLAHVRDLDARESRWGSILDALPDPVVGLGHDGRPIWMNRSFAALLPGPDEPGPDRSGPDRSGLPEVVGSNSVEHRPDGTRSIEEAIRTADAVRWFAWIETDMTAPDGTRFVLRSGRETTDRIAAERALEEARSRAEAASEAKSRFLATVSHEFRTPLNGILGMSELLQSTPLDPEQASYVQALHGSGEAFMSLIEEILDFSRIEAGRIDLSAEPFELEPLVQGVVELLAPRAQDKGIEISAYVGSGVPKLVCADRDRLRQVLFNLAGNAVKFTNSGGVGICVLQDEGGETVFAVADTGPGIPSDRIELIFEDFEQAVPADRGSGTGLGLAITRRIVDRMSGRIDVESILGHGSTFRVTLPLPAVAEAAHEATAIAREAAGLRVLIVASSPFEARFLARRLSEAGAETAQADTAEAAVSLMNAAAFDIMIADASLGDLSARAVALGARRAGIGRTIVLLSPFERRSFGSPHAAGFDAYLVKPVRSRSLFERLAAAPAEDARQPAPADTKPVLVASRKAPSVLLAEDNEINALVAMKALERVGAVVTWAKDGEEALRLAEASLAADASPFDLILMDMRMPGLDGAEVTRRIREREALSGRDDRCRIVALTASLAGHRDRYQATAGFDGFLTKPISLKALAAELPFVAPDLAKAS